jgi:hypothetical protein
MSSLHQIKRSKYYYFAYRNADGVRTLVSTKETNKKRAQIKADALERAAEEIRRGDSDRRFFQQIMDDGLRRLGHESTPRVAQFLHQWLSSTRPSVSETTYNKYSLSCRLFLGMMTCNHWRITDVNSETITKFIDKLLETGRNPSTINLLVRRCLSIPFRQAFASGEIPSTRLPRSSPYAESACSAGYSRKKRSGRYSHTVGVRNGMVSCCVAGSLVRDWETCLS